MRDPSAPSNPREVTGERRQLTIVFVDPVESTRLSEQIDSEDLAALIVV